MADYFIAISDQQQGPFPAHELPSRGMRPDSKVWCEGMGDWQRADSVPELAALLPGRQQPPMPPPGAWPSQSPQHFSVPTPPSMMQYGGPQPYNPANSNRVAAGVCGIILGGLGVHKFILGQTGAGITMLLISILSCGFGWFVMHLIGLIEGIIYLTKTDAEFHQIYVVERRSWF